ncbi:MAG: carbon storage regulator CsrA [Clostridiales bacterium]|jgi:carbon storage regulator
MLVLSRKLNEEIRISADIVIKIISLSENQVKIGIEAPGSVKILRGEVYEKIKENTIAASESSKQKLAGDISKLRVNKIKK